VKTLEKKASMKETLEEEKFSLSFIRLHMSREEY